MLEGNRKIKVIDRGRKIQDIEREGERERLNTEKIESAR
jgi:hypothetical protein